MRCSLEKKVQAAALLIEDLRLRLQPRRILKRINENREEIAEREEDLNLAIIARIERGRSEVARLKALLEGRSPLTILSRGYCIAERDGKVIRSAVNLSTGDRIGLRMAGGVAKARIEDVYHDKKV